MIRLFPYTAAAALCLTLAACNGEDDTSRYDDNDLGQTAPVNAVQDAASGPVGITSAAIVGGDTEAYLRNTALGNMYEIEAAEIAMRKSESSEVQELAQMILDDHARMEDDMDVLLRNSNLSFDAPNELDERRQGLIDNLNAASDDTFNMAYLEQQAAAHSEMIMLNERYASDGDHEALADFADDTLPMLENHLDAVNDHLDAATDGY